MVMLTVEDLLHREHIYFKSAGKDVLVHCLNPEHDDSKPSMRIDRINGMFNCFSCGHHGNLFTTYNESVDLLGIKVINLKKKIAETLNGGFLLPLGCEPFNRAHRGISIETYNFFGAFIHDNYDGRIVFPIYDITGKLIGVMGRYAFSDAQPKYMADPHGVDLPLYPPTPVIYRDSIIVVEGIFDMLNLWDKGLNNVVCAFGKSMGETKKHARRAKNLQKFLPLKIQGVKKVYVLFDKGAETASSKLADMLSDLFITESIEYPLFNDFLDPGNLNQDQVNELKEYIYES
jgi:DNA primase